MRGMGEDGPQVGREACKPRVTRNRHRVKDAVRVRPEVR
jgi:hypothetical protein